MASAEQRFAGRRQRHAQQLLLQYTSNKLTLTPDLFASMSVTCTGTGTPIPDCTSSARHQDA